MPEVTPELLRIFIRRIDVWERATRYSHTCGNRIDIIFTFEPAPITEIKGQCLEIQPVKTA